MISIPRLLKESVFIVVACVVLALAVNLFHPRGFLLVSKKEFARQQVVSISALEAKIKLDGGIAFTVDTRGFEEFSALSIPGAVNIPAYPESVRARALEKNFSLLSSKKEPVLFCTGMGCGESGTVADALLTMGYKRKIYIIETGLPGWQKKGYPVTKEEKAL